MRKIGNWIVLMVIGVIGLTGLTGCPTPTETGGGTSNTSGGDHSHDEGHDHDHDHGDHDHGDHDDHAHAMGPKGGHVIKFDDGKGYAAWDHKDNEDRVIVYLLSDDQHELKGRKVTKAYFVATSGDQRKEFELTPTDADAEGVASTFERVDKALLAAVQIGTELIIETPEGELKVAIAPHVH